LEPPTLPLRSGAPRSGGLNSFAVLPVWAEAFLLLAAVGAGLRASWLTRRARVLAARLQARERGSHFLGESPEPRQIVQHAYRAAAEILPLSGFNLFRVDASQTIHEVWILPPVAAVGEPRLPERDASHELLGERIDAQALLQFAATETDRSFAPAELLPGAEPTQKLHLPLYSGDVLVAYLTLASPQPIDETRKGEIRALLAPLTASLHASRNWQIAVTDELSGLSSRRYFETRFSEEWARHRRYGAPLTVALFDLDHFKRLNDTHGHGAGDMAIRRFGGILQATVRASDLPCRYGGEEFAVLFPETPASAALSVADRVRRTVEREPFSKDGRPFRVTVSAGVADTDGLSSEDRAELLVRADKALYYAKDTGRNRARLFTARALARRR
jgi:diguanylate cyclase (GGDEF)-like protein